MRTPIKSMNQDVGFQIAPMIDVVFVILIFFMALAAQIRIEQILQSKLPGVAVASTSTEFIDEQMIQIDENGEISLNDEVYDPATSRDLPNLKNTLSRLKQSSDAAKSKVLVTILSHPDSPYYRTIDALNALSTAGITNVTFNTESDL